MYIPHPSLPYLSPPLECREHGRPSCRIKIRLVGDAVRARNKQETQRTTCDTAREPKTMQNYVPRALCTQSLLHGSTRLGYFESIIVAFRGHGCHALRLMCSSLLLVFPVYFELRRCCLEAERTPSSRRDLERRLQRSPQEAKRRTRKQPERGFLGSP